MYKGREGQWAFYLHRLSGLAILAYFLIHVISISLFVFGEKIYMSVHGGYDFILFRLGLIAVAGGVMYHAMNGLRIIIMDFTGKGVAYQRQLWYGVLAISVIWTIYVAAVTLPRVAAGV